MSLVAFGLRIATVRAIRAAIWPGFSVVDSPQVPLDLLEDGCGLIAIYTGHDTERSEGRDLFGGLARVALTIQIFLPASVTVEIGGKPVTFDTRKEGAETLLDVISRRISGCLLAQAEPWSEMVFALAQEIKRTSASSYLVQTDKVRASARELVFECDTIQEPIPGAPPADAWADLVAAMRTDIGPRGVAPIADWIAAEIQGPQLLSQAERDRIDLGLSIYAAERVGILPVVENIGDVPPADTVTIDEVSADPDSALATANLP